MEKLAPGGIDQHVSWRESYSSGRSHLGGRACFEVDASGNC